MRRSDNSVHYYFVDQIGSTVLMTNADASVTEQDIEYHPYGEQQVYTDTLGQEYRFTGKEHDPETNNDYFGARYYASNMGRFMTPDWAATPVPVPYANPGLPQTLNLYSYVANNPVTGIDPDGHEGVQGEIDQTDPKKTRDASQQQKEAQDKKPSPPSSAVFYDANNKRTTLPVGDKVILTTPGQSSTNPVGTAQREIPYDAATVTPSGVKPTRQPTEIQMQEQPTPGTHIAVSCQTRCSNKTDPETKDFNVGRFTDVISIGSGKAFGATQTFYFGASTIPATIVMELSPGYYQMGTSTQVTATADSDTRAIR